MQVGDHAAAEPGAQPADVGEFGVIAVVAAGPATIVHVGCDPASFARDVADRVIMMADGQVIEEGPPAQLFSQPSHPRTKAFLARIL